MNQQEIEPLGNWKQKLNRIRGLFQMGDEGRAEGELQQWRKPFADYLKELDPDEARRFEEMMRDLDDPEKTLLPDRATYNDYVLRKCREFLDGLLEKEKKEIQEKMKK